MPKDAAARQCVGMSDSGAKNRFKTDAMNETIEVPPHATAGVWEKNPRRQKNKEKQAEMSCVYCGNGHNSLRKKYVQRIERVFFLFGLVNRTWQVSNGKPNRLGYTTVILRFQSLT